MITVTLQFKWNNAWTVPDRLRLNGQGQPRLASACAYFVKAATRACLCFPSSIEEFNVQVHAKSNRAVLQGKIDQLAVNVKQSKSSWLNVNQFDLQSVKLDLGWKPLFFLSAPMLFILSRSFRFLVIMYWYLWTVRKLWSYTTTNNDHSFLNKVQSIEDKIQRFMSVNRCKLDYNLILTDRNLADSMLLRRGLKSVLQSLMENSVLKTAAAAGDTAEIILMENEKARDSSSSLKEPKFKLTRLLSATSFELRETPSFADGRLIMFSKADIPDGSLTGDSDRWSYLDFTLRTSLKAGKAMIGEQKQNVLQFAYPECRFDVTAAPLPDVIGGFLPPVLWLPVGSGIAIPLGEKHELKRAVISNGKCQLNGRVSFSKSKYSSKENQNLLRDAQNFFENSSNSLPSLKAAKSNPNAQK